MQKRVVFLYNSGGDDAWIKFNKLDMTTPVDILGNLTVIADVETKKIIGNDVKLSVKLKKSNLGSFKWEVKFLYQHAWGCMVKDLLKFRPI